MYITYECLDCKCIFIIPTACKERMEAKGKYIACNFGHRRVRVLDRYGNIKEAMSHDCYNKVKGRVVQRGWSNGE